MGLSKYEGMFLLDTSRSAKDWDKVVAHVEDILKKNGAVIESSEKWGERKLAYAIGHHKRAVYLLIVFQCPGPAVGRIRRACQLSDVVVRVLVTVYDEKAKIAVEPEVAAPAAPKPAEAPAADEAKTGEEAPDKGEAKADEEVVVEPEVDDEAKEAPSEPESSGGPAPEKEGTEKEEG